MFLGKVTKFNYANEEQELMELSKYAKENAKLFLEEAEMLAKRESWGHAVALLLFSIEETTKSQLCLFRSQYLPIKNIKKRVPGTIEITKGKINDVFRRHQSKLLTLITQLILEIPNKNKGKLTKTVLKAIKDKDPRICREIEEILTLFKKVKKWNKCYTYVNRDSSKPSDITKEDYYELLEHAKYLFDRINSFVTYSFKKKGRLTRYEDLESNVKSMFGRV